MCFAIVERDDKTVQAGLASVISMIIGLLALVACVILIVILVRSVSAPRIAFQLLTDFSTFFVVSTSLSKRLLFMFQSVKHVDNFSNTVDRPSKKVQLTLIGSPLRAFQ